MIGKCSSTVQSGTHVCSAETATIGSRPDRPDAVNRLEGGSGADNLNAVMALEDPEYSSQSGVAENRLVGGSGNDILRGEFVESLADGRDRGLLNGGSGADQLRVIGGDAIVFAQAQSGARLVVRVAGAADHDWGAGDFIL